MTKQQIKFLLQELRPLVKQYKKAIKHNQDSFKHLEIDKITLIESEYKNKKNLNQLEIIIIDLEMEVI